jgi:hypothetical protein
MVGSVNGHPFIMPGLVPGIHVFFCCVQDVDVAGTSSAKTRFALPPGHDG